MMTAALLTVRQWPWDKRLTLMFPALTLLIAITSGSLTEIQPTDNKAALSGGAIFIALIFLCRANMAHFSEKTRWFLYQFWPVPAILLGYLSMRIFRLELAIEQFAIPQQDTLMIAIDQWLFGTTIPQLLQYHISPTLTLLMESAYLHFYYLLPIGSLLYFHFRDDRLTFLRLRHGIVTTLAGGFCFYFLLPVEGPISFIANQFVVPLTANHEIVYDAVNSFRFAYDCFPSLHTAIPWVTLLIAWPKVNIPLRLIMLAMTLAITASTMYLRYHYGADVIAGLIWAGAVGWVIHQRRDIVTFTTNQAMVS